MTSAEMSPTPSAPLRPPIQHETTAGNYFVSNYPPFSFWKPEYLPAFQEALNQPPKPGTPLGLYVHIPFCRKRCHFCYFKVYTDKDSGEIRGYLDAVLAELATYANKPFIGGRKLEFVYFGGGTPSYLSPDQLKFLTDGLKRYLPWDEVKEVSFECEPGTLTDHKLKAIRDAGITRLSLGIENFDDHILEINGRAHRTKEIARAYGYAREIGFPLINIDLIAGMVEETEENWQRNIEKTIELSPDSVTIYQMEVPFNTTIYQRMRAEGKLAAPVASWETKRRWVDEAFTALEKAGYTIGSAYTAVKNQFADKGFLYRDRLWAGADLLSLGVASFGHIGGVHYQNHHDFQPYVDAVNAGLSPAYRALKPTDQERYVREFILQMKLGSVDPAYFAAKFGTDPRITFADGLTTLKNDGFLRDVPGRIAITREGLMQVDRLLHEFFLPQHRHARYA